MAPRWLLASLLPLGAGCARPATEGSAPPASPWFEDVTERRGPRFTHDQGTDSFTDLFSVTGHNNINGRHGYGLLPSGGVD